MLGRLGMSQMVRMAVRPAGSALRTQVCCLSSTTGKPVQGTVKAFDARRGYGFITPMDGSDDVFVHQTQVRRTGFRFLKVGEEVEFSLEVSDKGRKAVNVTGRNGEVLPPRQVNERRYSPGRRPPSDGGASSGSSQF